ASRASRQATGSASARTTRSTPRVPDVSSSRPAAAAASSRSRRSSRRPIAIAPATHGRSSRVPAPLLVVAAAATTQLGAAIATKLFDRLGPAGTVFLRVAFAAVFLVVLWRPRVAGHGRRELALAGLFG